MKKIYRSICIVIPLPRVIQYGGEGEGPPSDPVRHGGLFAPSNHLSPPYSKTYTYNSFFKHFTKSRTKMLFFTTFLHIFGLMRHPQILS